MEIVLFIHKVRESISRMFLIVSTDKFCGAAILFDFLCLHLFLCFCNIELFSINNAETILHIRSISFHRSKFFMSITCSLQQKMSNLNKNYLLNWHIFLLQSIAFSLKPSAAYFMITNKFLFIPAQNSFCNLKQPKKARRRQRLEDFPST